MSVTILSGLAENRNNNKLLHPEVNPVRNQDFSNALGITQYDRARVSNTSALRLPVRNCIPSARIGFIIVVKLGLTFSDRAFYSPARVFPISRASWLMVWARAKSCSAEGQRPPTEEPPQQQGGRLA